jgi:hypothetical protein
MAIIQWEPCREIESMQQQLNQLFDRTGMPSASSQAGETAPPTGN